MCERWRSFIYLFIRTIPYRNSVCQKRMFTLYNKLTDRTVKYGAFTSSIYQLRLQSAVIHTHLHIFLSLFKLLPFSAATLTPYSLLKAIIKNDLSTDKAIWSFSPSRFYHQWLHMIFFAPAKMTCAVLCNTIGTFFFYFKYRQEMNG